MSAPDRPFTHLLCPLDLTEVSGHAFEEALAVATRYGARLTLLHVLAPTAVHLPDLPFSGGTLPQTAMEHAQRGLGDYLRRARETGVPCDVVIDAGQSAAAILSRAQGQSADLIVMGTHGAGGFDRLVLGSTTERVLRRASCPVLTVPPRAKAAAVLPFRHILCAVDFSDWSIAAATLSASLARGTEASVTLLHVLGWPWDESAMPTFGELPPAQASALDEYRRYMETSALNRLRGLISSEPMAGARCTPRTLHGKAYAAILKVAEEEHADLVVLGVHSRPAADMLFLGSTTNHVVRRAACPVLTLRR